MITVYLVAFNDEILLPFCIDHYRSRLPSCRIVVYDNFSTDDTAALALSMGCEVRQFYTAGKMDDQAVLNVKNNCWKNDKGWVIVCDVDEWLDIWEAQLVFADFTVIDGEIINMVGMNDYYIDVEKMVHGVLYDHFPRKMVCFNALRIESINYGYGCHSSMPVGDVSISHDYYIHHYKHLTPGYLIEKNKVAGPRLSQFNIKMGLSHHLKFGRWKIRQEFKKLRKKAIVLPKK